jgi:hypothetical protein
MLPAVIPIVSSLALYAPQMASSLMLSVATNVIARVASESITNRVPVSNSAIQAIADALRDPASQANLANITLAIRDKLVELGAYDINGSPANLPEVLYRVLQEFQGVNETLQDSLTASWGSGEDVQEAGLAQVMYDKICGVQELTLQINVHDRESMLSDYAEAWTLF